MSICLASDSALSNGLDSSGWFSSPCLGSLMHLWIAARLVGYLPICARFCHVFKGSWMQDGMPRLASMYSWPCISSSSALADSTNNGLKTFEKNSRRLQKAKLEIYCALVTIYSIYIVFTIQLFTIVLHIRNNLEMI